MTETHKLTYEEFTLPSSVVSRIDVSRLVSEVEWLDNEMTAAMVRAKTVNQTKVDSVLSTQLSDFLEQNKISLEVGHDRTDLIKQLRLLKNKVPVVHMTFAAPADHDSLQTLADWVRTSVHPQAVIDVGLQPALVGGVYVRTSNQVFDLSLRGKIEAGRGVLVKELEALRGNV